MGVTSLPGILAATRSLPDCIQWQNIEEMWSWWAAWGPFPLHTSKTHLKQRWEAWTKLNKWRNHGAPWEVLWEQFSSATSRSHILGQRQGDAAPKLVPLTRSGTWLCNTAPAHPVSSTVTSCCTTVGTGQYSAQGHWIKIRVTLPSATQGGRVKTDREKEIIISSSFFFFFFPISSIYKLQCSLPLSHRTIDLRDVWRQISFLFLLPSIAAFFRLTNVEETPWTFGVPKHSWTALTCYAGIKTKCYPWFVLFPH